MKRHMTVIAIMAILTGTSVIASHSESARPISDAQFSAKVQEAHKMVSSQVQESRNHLSAVGQQGQSKVEITSFIMAGSRTRAAEICGKAAGVNAPFPVVRVIVDPKSDKPGVYNVLAGKDGLFCATVVTFTGTAEASLADQGAASAPALATNKESRE